MNKKIVIIVVALLLALTATVSVVFAVVLNSTIKYEYQTRGATDTFAVGAAIVSSSTYHYETDGADRYELKVERRHKEGGAAIDKFDLLVFSGQGAQITAAGATVARKTTAEGTVDIITGIAYNSGFSFAVTLPAAGAVRIVALPSEKNNRYISNLFELKMLNDAKLHNIAPLAVPDGKFQDYQNVYLLSNIDINAPTTVNVPAYLNLLYFDVALRHDLTLKHPYRGVYAIETAGGRLTGNGVLNLEAPNSYYGLDTNALTDDPARLNIVCDVDFAADPSLKSSLIEEAGNFALARIPDIIFGDVALTRLYHQYKVTFAYEAEGGETPVTDWYPERGSDNKRCDIAVKVYYGGDLAGTYRKTVLVAGTSGFALNEALHAYLQMGLQRALTTIDDRLYFDAPFGIGTVLASYLQVSGISGEISLGLDADARLYFAGGGKTANAVRLSDQGGGYKAYLADGEVALENIELARELWIFTDKSELITVSGGSFSGTIAVTPRIESEKEKIAFLNRYIEHVFFNSVTDKAAALYFDGGNLFRGAGEKLVDGPLGFTDVSYTAYIVADSVYDGVTDEAGLQQAIDECIEDVTAKFSYENGFLGVKSDAVLSLREGQTIMLVVAFGGAKPYRAARKVIIPSEGLGGSQFIEYIKGDTFKPYFDSLDGGRLIDSLAGENGSAFKFRSEYSDLVKLKMYIEPASAAALAAYCTLVHTAAPTDYWQINIDVGGIPAANTVVRLYAEFYLEVDGVETVISTQPYSFIIPGIYRRGVGKEFPDSRLYDFIIAARAEGKPLYESYDGYLLSDGAAAAVSLLDLSGLGGSGLDLTGIELLTGTTGFVLDGNTLVSLQAFAAVTAPVTYLSLAGCGLTDGYLNAGAAYPLYNLKSLTTLNLNDNGLTALTADVPYFYRTLQILTAKNNTINDIGGIDAYPALTVLRLQNNIIASFEPLKGLGKLREAYIAGNVAAEFSNKATDDANTNIYYGSLGKINVPVYAALLVRGIKVYAAGDTAALEVGSGISADEFNAALILNAVALKKENTAAVDLPKYAYPYGTGNAAYEFIFSYLIDENLSAVSGVTQSYDAEFNVNKLTPPPSLAAGSVKVILALTYGSATVYRQFDLLFKR